LNARVGSKTSDLTLSLTEPWFMDRQLALGGELFYHDANYYSTYYTQRNVGADVFLRRPLGAKGSVKLDYRLEQVSINLDSSVPPGSEFLTESGSFLRSAMGLNYEYDSRDSNTEPREGEKINIGATLAGTVFGGDVNVVNVSARGQKYWNLWADTIFSINGELACVTSTDGSRVPLFERMFLGGGHTLRGYKFRDVGPRDNLGTTDEAIGGNSLGFLSMEYTVPVIDMVRFATFYDMGFVNAKSWDLSAGNLYTDAGIGVRVKLPISPMPLALDYAFPLNSPDSRADKGGQFNFYLNYQY
jgi:outer membrane protein insertion porin family